ncbi:MAG: aminoacyl-tRNA hydrolase [bacterium]|nr:aminoacyl-tRNA hydrolase [bacterium]
MAWIIVGLGNPGPEYQGTRHNCGRMALEMFTKAMDFGDWKEDKKAKAHVTSGMVGKTAVVCIAPDTFMNKSGVAVGKFVKTQKAAERMVVIYDDLDLPLGSLKLSFNRGSGGHRGVESIMKAVKTKKFTRVRVGVSPVAGAGKLKKPSGEKEVVDFILAKFKPAELDEMKKVFKKVSQALESIVADGPERAMNKFN